MIKKIWSDSVWSKVISAGILGLITFGYTKFVSVTDDLTFQQAWRKILEIKVSIVYVLFALFVFRIVKFWLHRPFNEEEDNSSIKRQELKKHNKHIESTTGVLYRWNVFFDYDTPFIDDLTAFCTKHGDAPIKFRNGRCIYDKCTNSYYNRNQYDVKNIIESKLLHEWETIK